MTVFETIMDALTQLEELTERKIEAATQRNSTVLLQLLQSELDPLTQVNRYLFDIARLTDEERDVLRRHAEHWQARSQLLSTVLQSQLGYCDFVLTLLGQSQQPSVNVNF
ncbi:hypothetical protein [Sulfobacillus sp. hq2]|uniref:FlgN family protein n=1 Tax=Sulfobacillus thermotolerans TaxID=338644 RepID=A0ABN5H363_9FIRM|nr:hypothetical protein [Sulfobacillus sp. hq2]AUW94954.1 hypothetical protein BXT84_14155 [Sulfobacillus thermotolerans]MCY0908211.1 hypothetical protein [Sulfobacillus thermotolerans]POB10444.1 hypothetical protein CO251_10920 [Sulfobacillus sp. hq2]